jgi:DNA-binding response OmpR family regulator
MKILEREPVDAVVLDVMLPDKGGMEIMWDLSQRNHRPALILSGNAWWAAPSRPEAAWKF